MTTAKRATQNCADDDKACYCRYLEYLSQECFACIIGLRYGSSVKGEYRAVYLLQVT
jgi:hypothetical protein